MARVNPNLPMGIKEFVPGEIYYVTSPGEYIFRYVDKTNSHDRVFIVDPYLENPRCGNGSGASGNSPWKLDGTRVATALEKAWFEACFKANAFISLEAIPPFEVGKIKVSYTTVDGEIETAIIDEPIANATKLNRFKEINYYITL